MKYTIGKRLSGSPLKITYTRNLFVCLLVGIGVTLALVHFLHKPVTPAKPRVEAGISMGSLSGIPPGQINQELASMSRLGFEWVRLDINWKEVQPHNSGQFNWNLYDSVVADARHHHLKILGILDYAPAWAAQQGCSARKLCAPKDPAQFAAFAAKASHRYEHDVQNWEIWNEENIDQFWSPEPSAAQYTRVLELSYKSIKAANPSATVILGGMAAGDNPNKKQIDSVAFLQAMYKNGAKGSFDAVNYHPYTYPRKPLEANTPWTKLPSLYSIMRENGDGDKKIWITEYGAPTRGPAGSDFVSEATQAELARSAFKAAQSKPWIGPFFWHAYQDRGTNISDKENFYGLLRADGSSKPAYYAWQELLKQ